MEKQTHRDRSKISDLQISDKTYYDIHRPNTRPETGKTERIVETAEANGYYIEKQNGTETLTEYPRND